MDGGTQHNVLGTMSCTPSQNTPKSVRGRGYVATGTSLFKDSCPPALFFWDGKCLGLFFIYFGTDIV